MASVGNSDIVASITMVMQSRWQQSHGTVATAGNAKWVGDSDVTCDRQQEHGYSDSIDNNSIPI